MLRFFRMAYLLGAEGVMRSLQTDVRDVQACVADIISRVGPVRHTSWKFPDKDACDLDIEDLLDLYSYSDDEEERQVAHIALYELVIDRLVLMLHLLAAYTEGVLRIAKAELEPCKGSGSSVGVVARRYWTRLAQLQQYVKETVQEKNAMNRKVKELEEDVRRLEGELKQARSSNRPKTGGMAGLIPPNRAEMITGLSFDPSHLKQFGLISKDEYNKSCQTNETAFTPCDSCSMVQKGLRQAGEIVVSICQQQQIPSCLQKFRPQVSHLDWLSGNDVSRWAAEQNKDLQRISKLTATIKPLKDELSDCSQRCGKLENRVLNFDRDLKKEKDERSIMHKQYQTKIRDLEVQFNQTLELERQQKNDLEQSRQELQKLVENHRQELTQQNTLLKDLENTKAKMEEELSQTKVDTDEVLRLEKEMTDLQGKLGDISTQMEKSSKELQKEQARYKSAASNNQSLQSKQQSLLQRISELDQENRELQEQIGELEEEKEQFEEKLNENKRETTQLERKLREKESDLEQAAADKESLEQTVSTLQESIRALGDRLEEAKDREMLILQYPDINGPVNPDLTGTGDIVVDMENQVKANNIRIGLLEKQNEGLRNSVAKLLQQHQLQQQQQQQQEGNGERWATCVNPSRPQPLWNKEYLDQQVQEQQDTAPEYASMENKYNQSTIYNNNYNSHSEKQHANKTGTYSGIHSIKFDESSVRQTKSAASKERPAFGHRPLTGNSAKNSGNEFLVGRAVRPESAKVKHDNKFPPGKGRPLSGNRLKNAPSPNVSAIGAYMQLKKEGKLSSVTSGFKPAGPKPSRGHTNIPTADTESNYSMADNFTCSVCDKMYSRAKDLEIHMSYCTG